MFLQEAQEEYVLALRQGQREYKSRTAAGKDPYPKVLDEIIADRPTGAVIDMGVLEIPAERIIGTKSAGRTNAFSAGFLPLLPQESEFASKWINLCAAHLGDGIQDPILCYEYLGEFYVQEGNKRVSVLRHMGATRIPAVVKRVMPLRDDSERVQAYFEFIEFHRCSDLYSIQFREPGDYAKLLSFLGKEPGEKWSDREKRTFSAYYQYFREAYSALGLDRLKLLPEEALLLWLEIYPFRDLGELSAKELQKTLSSLLNDFISVSNPNATLVRTEPVDTEGKPGLLSRLLYGTPSHLHVAFVHPLDPETSTWIKAHDEGSRHLEQVLGNQVVVRNYYHADTPQLAEQLLEQAVAEGAEVVFATTPQLRRSVLRVAVKHPHVRFFNCSVDTHFSSVPSYYGRIFEAKFITGALAGAMTKNDLIGYIADSPTFGVPASINAFALGAQLTNPRAKILLRWSCQKGAHQQEFLEKGIYVISNRDAPTENSAYLNFGNYGTYYLNDNNLWEALGSPVWRWGRCYENIIYSMLVGSWAKEEEAHRAVNYWWGMDSGVIDIQLSDTLPSGLYSLAKLLTQSIQSGKIDPFRRRIYDQSGKLRNNGSHRLSPDELLYMDWLCDNVIGTIPAFDEIEPYAQPMVRELGIYRDQIPMEKEGAL
ncbi:MAG: BMP family ABC transporter substrate-binding protein [Ruminococcaceae bacterium]|nr:BMP family ABC transporter substrate-binding protein [Oscillospiraceae bacterium]